MFRHTLWLPWFSPKIKTSWFLSAIRVRTEMLTHAGAHEDAAAVAPLARGDPSTDSGRVHTILTQCLAPMNLVFTARTHAWFTLVIREGIGMRDVWCAFRPVVCFAKRSPLIVHHTPLGMRGTSLSVRDTPRTHTRHAVPPRACATPP